MDEVDYREVLFSRYIGQYLQADEADAYIKKSSEEIVMELSGMATFTIDEISIAMTKFGYKIGFDDSRPVWLMKENIDKLIDE
jgi:hypothetical protein